MKNLGSLIILSLCLLAPEPFFAQISDQQVISYIKEAKDSGKGDKEIGQELLMRGVSKEQMLRIKQKYDLQNSGTNQISAQTQDEVRVRKQSESSFNTLSAGSIDLVTSEIDTLSNVNNKERQEVFGRNVFTNKQLTFEPNNNLATPANYQLGPGDEIIIDIWGTNEASIKEVISPEGIIMISQVGPVNLSGLTIDEASKKIKEQLSSKYADIAGDNPQSQISVTLGQIRSIQINIMGEVAIPGTYRLSSFSTVFHALYSAGGVSKIGSLRNINVMRNGIKVATVDVYNYILKGEFQDDIRLQEGDVIIVPPYSMLVNIEGNIKRPMYYEMIQGETIETLLKYSGGFTGDAYTKEARLIRRNGKENQIFSVTKANYAGWQLADGDVVTIGEILDKYANRIEIKGAVYRPGMYELGNGISTIKDLISRAEGLTGDAFTGRAILTRERADLTHEVIPVDLAGIMNGKSPDIILKKEDVLVIPSINELQAQGAFSIYGEVTRPGVFPYASNTTIEDLIVQAGGLLDGASTVRVDVSRRIKDSKSVSSVTEISKVYTFAIKDGFIIDGTPGFVLEPYDIVEVRRSPGYQIQRRVNISGEAVFTGGYTLTKKNERISDLVKRAGGLTADAYIKGGRLIRKMNEEERAQQESAIRMAMMNAGADSLSVSKIQIPENYIVGIDLDKALKNPGSGYDIVLREGDQLYVPEYISTVKITGEVQFPNTVAYIDGKKLSHYIEQAGGYSRLAKKSRVYIVHMNGTVSRVKRLRKANIEPGCQIIVPSKKERKPMSLAEIMSLGTSAASLGTMAATLYNLFK